MMTNGPEATVGQILEVPFARPRTRADVIDDPNYYDFRFALISFLEKQEQSKEAHDKAIQEKLRLPEPEEAVDGPKVLAGA